MLKIIGIILLVLFVVGIVLLIYGICTAKEIDPKEPFLWDEFPKYYPDGD